MSDGDVIGTGQPAYGCEDQQTQDALAGDESQVMVADVVTGASPSVESGGAISMGEGGLSPETDDALARTTSADADHKSAKSSDPAALIPPGAVKARKANVWERDPHDYYVEEVWCNVALFSQVKFCGEIYDPACGSGRIVKAARAAGYEAWGTDIVRRWEQCLQTSDFLDGDHGPRSIDNIVCNPPFRLCQARTARGPFAFVKKCLEVARYRVAILLPAGWHHSLAASEFLAGAEMALSHVLVLTPRPSMPPGRLIEAGTVAGNGTVDFAYYVFVRGHEGPPQVGWLRCPAELRKSRSPKRKGGRHG